MLKIEAHAYDGNVRLFLQKDDETPFSFVVDVLHSAFALDYEDATAVALDALLKGRAFIGEFSVAETQLKLRRFSSAARAAGIETSWQIKTADPTAADQSAYSGTRVLCAAVVAGSVACGLLARRLRSR